MPRTQSALKAARQNVRRRHTNDRRLITIERLLRTIRKTATPSNEQLALVQKSIDKAAKTRTISLGRANRLKSRLAKRTSQPKISKVTSRTVSQKKRRPKSK